MIRAPIASMISSHCFICADSVKWEPLERRNSLFSLIGGLGIQERTLPAASGSWATVSHETAAPTIYRREYCYGNFPVPGFSTVSL